MATDERDEEKPEQGSETSEVSDQALEAVSGGSILPLPGGPLLPPRLPIPTKPEIYVQPIDPTRIDI